KLRAIENRRCVARSANTGRSGFFNQRGDAMQPTAYWQPAAIRETLKANHNITFYTQHGDYLSTISVYLTALLVLGLIVKLVIDAIKRH
ncbi:MAG: apolipoprotein N-acyltransferase, partial [Bacteroidales bacterium]|nr:apolipoprotein N-acyltransferase [Bacteroidales bacterium]